MTELEFLARLEARIQGSHPLLVKGIGDDAAVWEWGEDTYGLLSVDVLHEHWDFDLTYHALRFVGYKAATSAISDICAMNGEPIFLLVALGIPRRLPPERLEEIYEGFRQVEQKYQVAVVGGDLSPARDLWISVTVVGRVEKHRLTYRSGARPGELIYVTGDLGGAYAGLKILQREKAVFLKNPSFQPDVSGFTYVVGRQLKPEARCDVVARLKQLGIQPTSMVDLSDGLAAGLHAIARSSRCGMHVYLDRLPYHPQTEHVAHLFGMPLTALLLYGGEEYELLFTVPKEAYETLLREPDIYLIGHTQEEAGVYLEDPLGQVEPIQEISWDSLSGQRDSPAS
ncbi:MAG: thiamine-phosphate kinase [Bacteroidia bacterium]|nr:thiamine-phosphate kinase [Bacteroidia bacterium]MDW8089253.1 thiamine-phosphate kinase [Bacteroidia bacterium]